MERKIGEIFEYNGEWYQTVKSQGKCMSCDFMVDGHCIIDFSSNGSCFYCHRKDGEDIIFKKLEKVGEPYNIGKKVFQRYEVFTKPYIFNDEFFTINTPIDDSFISIEIKQNEDMEECNNTNLSNSENIGKNLKPFSLEAAKAGKPVCTKDGRKARIICFDYKGDANAYPILALISTNNLRGVPSEIIAKYTEDGRYAKYNNVENDEDLMMLPGKKEGWVNLYKDEESKRVYCGEFIFSDREKAEKHYECNDTKVATVSINWEE